MTVDWNRELVDQLGWHWDNQARPRLEGLTDEEYLWEPVEGAWSVRRREDGSLFPDWEWPPPEPVPFTTIAWRMCHLIGPVFGARVAAYFPPNPEIDFEAYMDSVDWPGTADEALALLDESHRRWRDGVAGLGPDGLAQPCGKQSGPYADHPMAALVLHINREAIHHLAEIALLRDLYAARP